METRARFIGYLSLASALVLLAYLGGLFRYEAEHGRRVLRIRFPETGTLMTEDPVTQNGVPIGKVLSITLDPSNPNASVTEIELFHNDFIPADSRFVDFNHSMMGSRNVVLVTGTSPLPLDATRIQAGFYAPGVAETLHRAGELLDLTAEVRQTFERLFTDSHGPFSPNVVQQRMLGSMNALD